MSKLVLIAVAVLVLASLACGSKTVRPYAIMVPGGLSYRCVSYEYLDSGDLQLKNCVCGALETKAGDPLIANPIGVTITMLDN